MSVAWLCFICCIVLQVVAKDLQQVYDAVMETGVPVFNERTLEGTGLVEFVNGFSKQDSVVFASGTCTPYWRQKYIKCVGQTTLFKNVQVEATLVVAMLKGLKFGVHVDATATAEAEHLISFLPVHSDSWLSGLKVDEGKVHLVAGSMDFEYSDVVVKANIALKAEYIRLRDRATLIDLEKSFLPELLNIAINAELNLPLTSEPFGVDLSRSSAKLQTGLMIPMHPDHTGFMSDIMISVVGFDEGLQAQLLGKALIQFPGQSIPVMFACVGNYNRAASVLDFSGFVNGDLTIPFQEYKNWWTFKGGKVDFVMTHVNGNVIVETFKFSGTSTLNLDGYVTAPKMYGQFDNNAQQFYIELDVEDRNLPNYVDLVTQDELVSGVEAYGDYITLALTNFESYTTSRGFEAKSGMNIFSNVNIEIGSELQQLTAPLLEGAVDVNKLFLQVTVPFNALDNPQDVFVSLSADSIVVSDELTFLDTKLVLNKREMATLDASTLVQWTPDASKVVFYLNGEVTSTLASFTGGLVEPWEAAFGLNWLRMREADVELDMGKGGINKFSVDAAFNVAFADDPDYDYRVVLTLGSGFRDIFFSLNVQVNNSPAEMATAIVQGRSTTNGIFTMLDASVLADVQFVDDGHVQIAFASTQFMHDGTTYSAGITVDAKAIIQRSSHLINALAALYGKKDSEDMVFHFGLYVPLDHQQNNLRFQLRSGEIQLRKNILFRGAEIDISVGAPTTVGLSGSIEAILNDDTRPIVFAVDGELDTNGIITLSGAMERRWAGAFNIPGLELHSAFVSIGLMNTAPYLSSFGLGGNTTIGDASIAVSGLLDLTSSNDLFFQAHIDDLSLRNVFSLFNSVQRSQYGTQAKLMDLTTVPKYLVIKDLDLQFAPRDAVTEIDDLQVVFTKGMELFGDMKVLGLKTTTFHLRTVYDRYGVNFLADLDIHFTTLFEKWTAFMRLLFPRKQFQESIEFRQLQASNPRAVDDFIRKLSNIIPQIIHLVVDGFDFRALSTGQSRPNIYVKVLFREKEYEFGHKVSMDLLTENISILYSSKIINWRELFGLPQCILSSDCPSSQQCYHNKGDQLDNTCVDSCGPLGRVPFFGCVKCRTSAECSYSGSQGACCMNGNCQPASTPNQYCGMCGFGRKCNSPSSGCIFTFCTTCITSLDCGWNGSSGRRCIQGKCQ